MKSSKYDTFWGKVLMKLKKLGTAIEVHYGIKMDIDNVDYRWVDDRIQYLEKDGRKLRKLEEYEINSIKEQYTGSY